MTAAPDSLQLELRAPAEARVGARVPLVLRVENRGGRPLQLYLRGRTIAFDVVVTREDGTVVWRRLEGEIIPAVIQVRPLAPGEVLELRTHWHQRNLRGTMVKSGLYLLRGLLLTDAEAPLESAPVHMRIKPR